jgi:hypothetical protein
MIFGFFFLPRYVDKDDDSLYECDDEEVWERR